MKLGGTELLVIVLVMALALGPERTVLYARKAGKWLRVLKIYLSSMTEDLRESVVEPLEEIREPLKEIVKPIDELTRDADASVNAISASMERASRDLAQSIDPQDRAAGGIPEEAGTARTPEKPAENDLEMAEFLEEEQ